MKKSLLFFILLITALLLTSCAGPDYTSDPNVLNSQQYIQETVYIGSVLPLSGNNATRAKQMQTAQGIAMDLINNNHDISWDLAKNAGISGFGASPIQLVYRDSADLKYAPPATDSAKTNSTEVDGAKTDINADYSTKPDSAIADSTKPDNAIAGKEETDEAAAISSGAAGELLDLGVIGLVGAYDSAQTILAQKQAQLHEIPLVIGAANNTELTSTDKKTNAIWVNRIAPTLEMESTLFFNCIRQLSQADNTPITKIAIAYEDTDYGRNILSVFNEVAKNYSFEVVGRIAYQPGLTSLAVEMEKMLVNDPQVIFHAGSISDTAAFASAYAAASFQPEAAFYYGSGFQSSQFSSAIAASGVEYWCGLSVFPRDISEAVFSNGDMQIFNYINGLYRSKTGQNLDNELLWEMASVLVIAQAINACNTTDSAILAATLKDITFDAPYLYAGKIDFDESGQNIAAAGYVARLNTNQTYDLMYAE